MAAWVSLRENFPGISIHGCLFHYSQAIYKRVGFLGLTGLYKQDTHVREVVRKLFALPLLPHRRMVEVFASMLVAAEDADYDPKLSELLSYVDKTWFHSPIWSSKEICSYQRLVRTNNDCEGYHRRLKERCGTSPPIYKLVECIHNEASVPGYILGDLENWNGKNFSKKNFIRVLSALNIIKTVYIYSHIACY